MHAADRNTEPAVPATILNLPEGVDSRDKTYKLPKRARKETEHVPLYDSDGNEVIENVRIAICSDSPRTDPN